ncbi:MAG: AAA family ATPase [Gemmatimonadota bacterium]|nr:AAA family ATPase [Gemmatimonadota bacterium]
MSADELRAVLPQLKHVKSDGGGGYTARCPAHDDQRSSLSLGSGRDGKLLLTCHAGCTFTEILAKLDCPARAPTESAAPLVFPYVDESGKTLYEVVRYQPKEFRQRRPDGSGGYIWKLGDVRRVLYRLPEIIEAVSLGRRIYIVEGEKDVDSLLSLGLDATTIAAGAGAKWLPEYSETLRGADVVVLPDNDEPGRQHAEKITSALVGIAQRVRTLSLPDLPEHGDVTDWLMRCGDVEHLLELIDSLSDAPRADQPAPRVRLFDDEEIGQIPEPEWIVPGVIPGNALAQLFGPSESLKSFVALDLCCHIATGLDWHGRPVARGNVVYVMAEGIHGAKHRVSAWKKYHRVSGKIGVYFVRHRLEVVPDSEDLKGLIEAVEMQLPAPPALIVIDTLARNMKGNENATEDMNAFIAGLDSLRQTTGATVLVVHHTGWTQAERGRGNSSNHCAMDTDIQADRDGDRVTLQCKKQKDAAHFPKLTFEAVPVLKSLVLKPMDQTGGTLDGNRLVSLQALHRSPDGLTNTAWRKEAGLDEKNSSFQNARDWLQVRGYVKPGADKKYLVTEAGRLALGPRSIVSPSLVHSSEGPLVHVPGVYKDPGMDQTHGLASGSTLQRAVV